MNLFNYSCCLIDLLFSDLTSFPRTGLLQVRHHLRGEGHQDEGDVGGRERAVADQVHGALPGTQFNRTVLA